MRGLDDSRCDPEVMLSMCHRLGCFHVPVVYQNCNTSNIKHLIAKVSAFQAAVTGEGELRKGQELVYVTSVYHVLGAVN